MGPCNDEDTWEACCLSNIWIWIYIYAVKPCNFIPPVECKISSKELMWTWFSKIWFHPKMSSKNCRVCFLVGFVVFQADLQHHHRIFWGPGIHPREDFTHGSWLMIFFMALNHGIECWVAQHSFWIQKFKDLAMYIALHKALFSRTTQWFNIYKMNHPTSDWEFTNQTGFNDDTAKFISFFWCDNKASF